MSSESLSNLLTVVIPTFNEEMHLPRVLANVSSLNVECFVVDSNSEDLTVSIANEYGCNVFQGQWKSFSEKINWALSELPIKTPWVMRLDADEYLTEELINELSNILPLVASDVAGLFVNRRLVHMGHWMKYGGCYPNKSLRIFRRGKAKMEERLTDEKVILEGASYHIKADIVDEPMRGMLFWARKHLIYAKNESLHITEEVAPADLKQLDRVDQYKRFIQQKVYYRLPLFFRVFLYWCYRYFLRFGFLDGKKGFVFHFLHAFWYRFFVDVLIFEERYCQVDSQTNKKSVND